MTTPPSLDRANRLRWRARLLDLRARDVMAAGNPPRALRISERAARAHYRADRAILAAA